MVGTLLTMDNDEGGTMLTTSHSQPSAHECAPPFTTATPRKLRLLVVDDHPAVRVGLERLLDDEHDFEVVSILATAQAAVAKAADDDIDLAIVDYHLGGHSGLWVCRMLKRLPRPPRVVIFSAFANDHLAASCVVAGADALLSKGSLGSDLCDTIRSVARGRRAITAVTQPMADMLRRRLDGIEQPIFGMLLAGLSREQIERTLHISAQELESHESAMLSKLERLPGERNDCGRGRTRTSFGIPRR
jgi:DNA-binding NarL/FixJ family response regulator